jgi:hypothetical protein
MENDVIMNMFITVHPDNESGSFMLDPVNGYVMTDLDSGAQWPPESVSTDDTKYYPPPQTSGVDVSGGTWLITQTAESQWIDKQSAHMTSTLKGYGPAPSGDSEGIIGQDIGDAWQMDFIAPVKGVYEMVCTVEYDGTFSLKQGEGSSYPLNYFWGYSEIRAYFWFGELSPGVWDDVTYQIFMFDEEWWSGPILDFYDSVGDGESFTFTRSLEKDSPIYFMGSNRSAYLATTPVPVAPSLLLLGSGLLALGLLGRRKKGD